MAIYNNINDALQALNFGTLESENEIRHATGLTTKNIFVWLPIIDNTEEHWTNVYLAPDIVVQKAKPRSKSKWQPSPLGKTHQTITRTTVSFKYPAPGKSIPIYDYDHIGEFCPVYCDSATYITVYASKSSPYVTGTKTKMSAGGISWTDGFAGSLVDAKNEWEKLQATIFTTKGIQL
jgi:hypothetical protein